MDMWTGLWLTIFVIHSVITQTFGQKPVCGHPGAPANGNFFPVGATFTVDTVIKYKCDSGYLASGNEQRKCLRNGTWTGQIPFCADKNIALGKVTSQSAIYRQQRPSLAVDGLDSSCASTPRTPAERWWQLNLGRTVNVALVSVTMLVGASQDFAVYVVNNRGGDDSQIVYSKCGNYTGFLRTKTVEIRCKNGTGMQGEYVFIRDNRQGAFTLVLCEVAVFPVVENRPCGQPERPINSFMKPVNQTAVRYGCLEGFTLVGSQVVHCKDGLWESTLPYCSETFCPAPPPVGNSKWTATYAEWFPPPDKSHFPFGTVLSYSCNPTYLQDGNGSLVCTSNGSWAGTQPKCLPTACDPPPLISNATLHFPNGTSPTRIGVRAEVRCDSGFQLTSIEQPFSIECYLNGSWSDNGISCQPLAYENMQPALGAVLGIITVLIITGLVVVALVYLRKMGYLKGSTLWPHHNLGTSPSGVQLEEVQDESSSKPIGFDQSFNDDEDMLYDDVWPAEESVEEGGGEITSDGLYADATSSHQHLDQIGDGGDDVSTDDGQRIYDQPNDDVTETENVYYCPTETREQRSADGIDRSELPPADGAADSNSNGGKNGESGCAEEEDHIYEPLRRPVSPNVIRTRPVYAKVDVMNKKFRRSLEEEEMAGNNSIELRQPPEGVTYTTPVFASETNPRDSSSQRPLPPIPNPPGSRCSVMIDNALYVQGL